MPVSRLPQATTAGFRCSTALGTVLVALLAVGTGSGALAQSTISNSGNIPDGGSIARTVETLTIESPATVTFDGSATINLDDNNNDPNDALIINSGASFIAQAGTINFDANGQQEPDVTNDGTMTVDGAGSITNVGDFTNTGTAVLIGDVNSLTVSDGTVTVGTPTAGAGTLSVSGSTVVADDVPGAASPLLAIGNNILDTTGTVTIGSNAGGTQEGLVTIGASGQLIAGGGVTIEDDGELDNSLGGTITGNVTLNTGGTLTSAGTIDGDVTATGQTLGTGVDLLAGEITGELRAGPTTLTGDLTVGGNVIVGGALTVGVHHLDAGASGTSTVTANNVNIGAGGQISANSVITTAGSVNMVMNGGSTVTGDVNVDGAGSNLRVNGLGASITGDLTIAGGDLEGVTGSASDSLDVGGTLTVNGDLRNIALSGGSIVLNSGVNVIDTDVTLDFDSTDIERTTNTNTGDVFGATSGGSLIVSSAGLVTINSALTFDTDATDDVSVLDTGTLNVNANADGIGVFTQDGDGSTVDVAVGTDLTADGFVLTQGTMTVGAGASIIGLGNTVTVGGGATVFTMNLADGADITDNGNLVILDNGVVDFAANGAINVDEDNSGGASVTIAAAETTLAGTAAGELRIGGTVTIGGGGGVNATVAVTNDGLIDVAGGATLTEAAGDTVNISGNGDLTIAATGAVTVSDFDNGTGTADIDGTLTLDDGAVLSNAGTINVSNAIDVGATGSIANTGALNADAGAVTITGSLSNTGAGTVDVTDGVDFDVTGTVTSGGTSFALGTLGAGESTFGALTTNGGTLLTAARSLSVTGDLTNSGTVTTTSAGDLTVGGAFTNSGGTLNVEGDLEVTSTAGILTNAGTISLTGATNTETFTVNGDVAGPVALNNSGAINMGQADLAVGAPGTGLDITNTGSIDVDANGVITADSFANNGTGTGGNGVVTLGGTITLGGGTGSFDNSASVTTDAATAIINADFVNLANQNASLTVNADTDLNGALTNQATGTVTVADGADFDVTGAVINGGAMTLGTHVDSTSLASLTNQSGGVINAARSLDIAGALTNSGAITTTDAGNLTVGGALTNNPAGSITVDGDLEVLAVGNILTNAGTISLTGATDTETFTVNGGAGPVTVTNSGTINLGQADLLAAAPTTGLEITNTGTIDVDANGEISANSFVNNGTGTGGNGVVRLGGTLTIGGGTGTLDNNASVTTDADGAIIDANFINLIGQNATLAVTADTAISGALTNQATGTVTVSGSAAATVGTALSNGGALTVNGSATLAVLQAATTVNNTGSFTVNGTGQVGADTGGGPGTGTMTFNNLAAGSLVIGTNADLFADVTNDGTMNVDGTIDGNLLNQGTNASTLGGVVTGTVTNTAVAAGAPAGLTVDGALRIDGGGAAGSGALDNTGELDVNAAITGTLNNDAGGITTLGGGVTGDVTNDAGASLTVDGSSTVGGTVTNDAIMTIATGGFLSSTNDVVNNGTLQFTGGTVDANVDSNGAVTAGTVATSAMTSRINGSLASGGTLTVLAGNQLTVVGGVTNEAGQLVDINGTLVADLDNTAAGTQVDLDGALTGTINNQSNLDLAGFVTGSVLNFTANGDLDIDGPSTITVELRNGTGGSVNVNDNQTLSVGAVLNGVGTLDVLGTVQGLGGGTTTVTNAGDVNLIAGTITGRLNNSGTASSDGTSRVTSVDNTGTFDLDSGTLTVSGGFVNRADLNIDAGTILVGAVQSTGSGATTQVDGLLQGSLQNENGSVATIVNGVTGAVTNASGAQLTVGSGATTGAVTNTGGAVLTVAPGASLASLSNAAGGVATLAGDINGSLANTGDLTIIDDISIGGGTVNAGNGILRVGETGTLNSTVIAGDTGAVTNAGTILGNVVIQGAGNGATMSLAGGTITGDVEIQTNGRLASSGASSISGDVTNNGGLLTTTAGTLSIGGSVSSTNNNLTVDAGATTSVAGGVSATLGSTVSVAGTLETPLVSLSASELLVAPTGTVDGNASAANGSTVDLDGTITGNLTVAGSTIRLGGDVGGALSVTGAPTLVDGAATVGGAASLSGLLDMDASLSVGSLSVGGDFDLAAGTTLSGGATTIAGESTLGAGTITNNIVFNGPVTAAPGLNLAGVATNAAGFRSTGNVNYSGTLVNRDRFSFAGNVARFGGLTNAGTFTTQNDRTNDAVTVTGALTVEDGAVFEMDVDLNRNGPSVDTVVVRGGPATGTGVVNFNDITSTNAAFTNDAVLVFDLDQSQNNDLELVGRGLPASGATAFVFTDNNLEANGLTSGDYAVVIGANPAIGGIAGGIALTQSLIGSVINRPSSPFVAGLAAADENPCGIGVWSRGTGGAATTVGRTTTNIGTFEGEVEATYGGIQIGGDYACFDGFYNGWDLAFGGILGLNQGSTEQLVFDLDTAGNLLTTRPPSSITETDFQQTYLGAYVAAARGPLLADLQFRVEETTFDISNRGINGGAPIGLNSQEFGVSGYTLSGSLSYAYPINEELGITVIPTAGFSYTRSETDTLSFADGSTLSIDDSTSEIGFIGATIARTVILPDQVSAINYFATGTVYNDFSDGTRAIYDSSFGTQDETSATNLGTYGELSLGLNYTRILQPGAPLNARQINGSIRLDGRTGEDIDSWGLTAQVRVQF